MYSVLYTMYTPIPVLELLKLVMYLKLTDNDKLDVEQDEALLPVWTEDVNRDMKERNMTDKSKLDVEQDKALLS